VAQMEFPKLALVKQIIASPVLEDVTTKVAQELDIILSGAKIAPGARIAVTAGSRGIKDIVVVLKTIVAKLKDLQAVPFIVPAMGSHGGATAAGQIAVLEHLGVTESSIGAPICSSMEVAEIGITKSGIPVFVDKLAAEADGIIVVNRIKPHTEFEGQIESGLMKMMVIGLGKHRGASMAHRYAIRLGYEKVITEIARTVMAKLPVLGGLAIVENAYDQTAMIQGLQVYQLEEEEKKLLKKAKELMARLPFPELDVLLIDQIGKEISGTGMDSNVTGRILSPFEDDPLYPRIIRIVAFDLTEATNGSAVGVGLADFTTRRLFQKIDFQATYINSLTAGVLEKAKIPIICENDREAVENALNTCGPVNYQEAKLVRVKNTLELGSFLVSEALLPQIRGNSNYIIEKEQIDFDFDEYGNFSPFPL
jgi:hypothetical protein